VRPMALETLPFDAAEGLDTPEPFRVRGVAVYAERGSAACASARISSTSFRRTCGSLILGNAAARSVPSTVSRKAWAPGVSKAPCSSSGRPS
jgi:hypothetical protein